MTGYGMMKGAVCELLHCSLSELATRCPSMMDEDFIIAYLVKKAEEEEKAMRGTR